MAFDFGSVLEKAITAGAGSLAKVGGAALGQSLFGGDSSGSSVGVSRAAENTTQNIQQIIEDDTDFQRAGLSSSGFVKGISDYRGVGAANVQAQTNAIADRGLERMISSLITSPPFTPEVTAGLTSTIASPRSVSSNRQSKKFQSYLKGLS
jgi:hypothetical protein|tara:strand:- start:25203 stop:25655 length:453 start_codon:yes stop_codon:yes gene_type:complete